MGIGTISARRAALYRNKTRSQSTALHLADQGKDTFSPKSTAPTTTATKYQEKY